VTGEALHTNRNPPKISTIKKNYVSGFRIRYVEWVSRLALFHYKNVCMHARPSTRVHKYPQSVHHAQSKERKERNMKGWEMVHNSLVVSLANRVTLEKPSMVSQAAPLAIPSTRSVTSRPTIDAATFRPSLPSL
jgi:hypothetical protein